MKKYTYVAILSMMITGLTSCLKDKNPNIDPDGSPAVVEFSTNGGDNPQTPSGAPFNIYTRSFDAVAAAPMVLTVNYTGGEDAPQDIQVGIGVNAAALATYNTAQKTSYTLFPASLATIPTSVTIPKGQRKASVNIVLKLNTAEYDFTKSYVLPIAITSTTAGGISGNYGTLLYRVIAKNAYEASYTVTGYLFHPTAGRALNATKTLATVGVNRCEAPLGDLGGSNYYVDFDIVGSTLTNYAPVGATPTGNQSGFFTADQPGASGSWAPAGATPGVAPWVHSTYNNTYDAANKTLWMHYGYGSGATSQAGWSRQVYEKWVRK